MILAVLRRSVYRVGGALQRWARRIGSGLGYIFRIQNLWYGVYRM